MSKTIEISKNSCGTVPAGLLVINKAKVIHGIHIAIMDKDDIERIIKEEVFAFGSPIDIKLPDCNGTGGPWTVDTFPREDVPCPCGNETHWLIKYEYL